MTPSSKRLALAIATAAGVVVADAATKSWALAHARGWPPPTGLGGLVEFSVTLNRGSAFGLGHDSASGPIVVATLAVALLAALAWLAARAGSVHAGPALGLAFGGTAGNLIDRALRTVEVWGEVPRAAVVDFIVIRFAEWPAFNLADVAIAVGLP